VARNPSTDAAARQRFLYGMPEPASNPVAHQPPAAPAQLPPPARAAAGARQRPLIVVCAVTLLALCGAVAIGARALIGSFESIEAAATQQKAMQVYRAFEADLRQLSISNRDYAEWDDAAEFVHHVDPRFIAANFVRETLTGMHVDVVWIVARDGTEVYSCYLQRGSGQIISPAPAALLRPLRRFVITDPRARELAPTERIVNTSAGLTSVSTMEIRRTDRSGATGAVMLFARFIQDAEIERIRQTSQLPVSVDYLHAGQAASGAPPALRRWIAAPDSAARTFVLAAGDAQISGYALIRDVDHVPVALFSTPASRDIYSLGYRTTTELLATLVALFIAFGAAVVWLLLRLQRSFAARHSMEVRYQRICSQLQESILIVDAITLRVVEANLAVQQALGCSSADLLAHSVQDVFPDIPVATLQSIVQGGGQRTVIESRACRPNGPWLDAEVAITSMEIDGRALLTLVGHDISHRRDAEERERASRRKLLQLAQHDALTGLPNRLYLHAKVPRILKKVAASERRLALVYVDVDHFKNINDSRGHGCGDQLLQIIARRLRAAVSEHDMVARMGGDEFVVVGSLLPDRQAIEHLAALLQTAVRAPLVLEEEPLSVTASMGIAVYPSDGLDMETLLKHADIALYQAKEAGRDCYRFYTQAMDVKFSEQVALEQSLRHALGSPQLFMHYQPLIDLRTGQVVSLEALMRWRHPELGLIPPSQFIPVAERTGLIVELGELALRAVLAQLRAWLDLQAPVVPIAVNVSPLQFDRTDFAALVARLAGEAGIEPRWLRFEITESAVMKEPEKLIGTLKTLRALGSRILIDDFGTGYSSLSYLDQLPIDTLKIDRAFVRDLGKDTNRRSIINAVIDMAKRLGLTTVAEGVETPEQAQLLLAQGCDYAQGFFYSQPVSPRHCLALLQELQCERPLTETMVVRALATG
jgi:diguanylate cyclase (GGDEF)-like protein/PAS domain S-box-containing protein